MVAATAPALHSIPDSARSAASIAALDRLKKPLVFTDEQSDALAHLDAARKGLKDAPKKAAAARIAQIKNKLMALKLASGIAAATGDLKAARAAIREVRDLLKELTKALRDAGILNDPAISGPAVQPATPAAVAPTETDEKEAPAATATPEAKPSTDAKPATTAKEAAPAEVAQAREDAKGILKELKKIVAKLKMALVAAELRGADPKEVKEAEKSLREAEKEMESLSGSLAQKADDGGGVDLRA